MMRREKKAMDFAARLYVRRMWNTEMMMRSIPPRQRLQVKYEEMCLDPAGTLNRISEFLGIETRLNEFTLKKTEFHGVGGNPMRFRYDESTVSLDEKWRRDLSAEELKLFEEIAGDLNRKLGYQD